MEYSKSASFSSGSTESVFYSFSSTNDAPSFSPEDQDQGNRIYGSPSMFDVEESYNLNFSFDEFETDSSEEPEERIYSPLKLQRKQSDASCYNRNAKPEPSMETSTDKKDSFKFKAYSQNNDNIVRRVPRKKMCNDSETESEQEFYSSSDGSTISSPQLINNKISSKTARFQRYPMEISQRMNEEKTDNFKFKTYSEKNANAMPRVPRKKIYSETESDVEEFYSSSEDSTIGSCIIRKTPRSQRDPVEIPQRMNDDKEFHVSQLREEKNQPYILNRVPRNNMINIRGMSSNKIDMRELYTSFEKLTINCSSDQKNTNRRKFRVPSKLGNDKENIEEFQTMHKGFITPKTRSNDVLDFLDRTPNKKIAEKRKRESDSIQYTPLCTHEETTTPYGFNKFAVKRVKSHH